MCPITLIVSPSRNMRQQNSTESSADFQRIPEALIYSSTRLPHSRAAVISVLVYSMYLPNLNHIDRIPLIFTHNQRR